MTKSIINLWPSGKETDEKEEMSEYLFNFSDDKKGARRNVHRFENDQLDKMIDVTHIDHTHREVGRIDEDVDLSVVWSI